MNRLVPEPAFDGQLIDLAGSRYATAGARSSMIARPLHDLDLGKRDRTLGPASIRLLLLPLHQAGEIPAVRVVAREHERFVEPDRRDHDPFREQLRKAVREIICL